MAVALLRSRGWRRGAVEKSRLANRCRREAVILPGGGLGKAPEGEERPSTRWPRDKERSIELRLTTLGHEAACSSPGPQVGSVLLRRAGKGGRFSGRGDAGCSQRPAGSRSLVTKALRGHSSHPLPSPASPSARRPKEPAGSGFPSAEFREVSPAARYAGRRDRKGGSPGGARECSKLRHRLFLFRACGESCRGPRTSPPGPRVTPGFELSAGRVQLSRGPRPSLQILDVWGLPEGSGLVPRDRRQPQAP